MSWKAPQRPPVKVSQCYNDGIANIFTVADGARPGYAPVDELTPKLSVRYQERKLGIQRYYAAAQNQIHVERVIRIPYTGTVTSQDVLIDEAGRRYRIDLVQRVQDVYPASVDLTLVQYEQSEVGV